MVRVSLGLNDLILFVNISKQLLLTVINHFQELIARTEIITTFIYGYHYSILYIYFQ